MAQPQVDILIKATTQGFDKVLDELDKLKRAMNLINQTGAVTAVNNLSSQLNGLSKTVTDLTGKINGFTTAMKQQADATQGGVRSLLTMQMTMQSYIADVTKMIAIQARWYGARMLLFAAVELPIGAAKSILEYTVALDSARSGIMRFAATSGQLTAQMVTDADQLVLAMRRALVVVPTTFKELNESVQAFVGAGVAPKTIIEMTENIARLKNAFPEINMNQFAVALTGSFNQFGESIKGAGSEAEKFRVIMETLLRAQAVGVIRPEQFTKVLQYMGPISSMAGFTLQQMASIAVVVTDMGRRAESAGRLSAGFINSLVNPKARENLEKIGIQLDKDKTLASQFDKIATQLREKIGTGAVTMGSLSFLSDLTSSDRLGVFVSFLQNYEKYVALTKDLEGAPGGLASASDAMSMSLVKQWQLLVNIMKEFGQELTSGSGGILNMLLGLLIEIAKGLLLAADSTGVFSAQIKDMGVVGTAAALTFLTLKVLVEGLYTAFVAAGWAVNKFVGVFFQGIEKIANYTGLKTIANFAKELKEQSFAAADVSEKELARFSEKWLKPSTTTSEAPKTTAAIFDKQKKVTGTGVGETANIKAYNSRLISNIKKEENALYQEEQSNLKLHLAEIDALYRLGAKNTEDYYSERNAAIESAEEGELIILERERSRLEKAFKQIASDISNSKIKNKAGALKENEQTRDAELAALDTKIIDTENRNQIRRFQTAVETNERLKQATKQRLEDEKTMTLEQAHEVDIINKASIERRQSWNEWLYAQNRIKSTTYYADAESLLREHTEQEKKEINDRYNAEAYKIEQLMASGRLSVSEMENADRDLTNLYIKNRNDMSAADERLFAQLRALIQKAAIDYRQLFATGGIGSVTKQALIEINADFLNWGKNWATMITGMAQNLADSFNSVFDDLIDGTLKTFGDYFVNFIKSIGKTAAKELSKELAGVILNILRGGQEKGDAGSVVASFVKGLFGGGKGKKDVELSETEGLVTNLSDLEDVSKQADEGVTSLLSDLEDVSKGTDSLSTSIFNMFTSFGEGVNRLFSDLSDWIYELFTDSGDSSNAGGLLGGILGLFSRSTTSSAATGAGTEGAGDLIGTTSSFAAKGNIYSGGRVVPFAKGGVVFSPTFFPMARGAGLMGERGPEAVMPLTRLPGGDLGVKAIGEQAGKGGGEGTTINNIMITATDAKSFEDMCRRNPDAITGQIMKSLRDNRVRGEMKALLS